MMILSNSFSRPGFPNIEFFQWYSNNFGGDRVTIINQHKVLEVVKNNDSAEGADITCDFAFSIPK